MEARVSKCAKENHMVFRLAGFSGIDKSDEEKLGYLETSNDIYQSRALHLSVICVTEKMIAERDSTLCNFMSG